MASLPKTWSRTLTVLRAMMHGMEVNLDGYRVTMWETEAGNPRLVVLATSATTGEDRPLGVDWTIEQLAASVGRMSEEEFVGVVGSTVLRDVLGDRPGVSR